MKENAKLAVLALVSCGVLYLSLEGTRSVARGDEPGISLLHAFLAERAEPPPIEALADTLQSRRELEARHQSFLDNRIMLGNTPYDDLVTTDARATYDDPEVGPRFKPNLTLRASHLRSRLFNAFDFFGLLTIPMSWGIMINTAHTQGYTLFGLRAWWLLLPAGLSVTLFAAGFFLIGRAMDEVVNPRLRAR